MQGSPHLGQRSWFPPLPDPPEPDILFPSPMLFCVNTTVSENTQTSSRKQQGEGQFTQDFFSCKPICSTNVPFRRRVLRPLSSHLSSRSRQPSLKTTSHVPRREKELHDSSDDQERRPGTWSTITLEQEQFPIRNTIKWWVDRQNCSKDYQLIT